MLIDCGASYVLLGGFFPGGKAICTLHWPPNHTVTIKTVPPCPHTSSRHSAYWITESSLHFFVVKGPAAETTDAPQP
jgi:hypothetical protein